MAKIYSQLRYTVFYPFLDLFSSSQMLNSQILGIIIIILLKTKVINTFNPLFTAFCHKGFYGASHSTQNDQKQDACLVVLAANQGKLSMPLVTSHRAGLQAQGVLAHTLCEDGGARRGSDGWIFFFFPESVVSDRKHLLPDTEP